MYFLAASCEIPESITFKGSPEVRLPLGSPLKLMDTKLEDFLNPEKLMEMMGGSDIKVYEYIGEDVDDGVEAYIILYPIIPEMELDLEDYIDRITENDIDFTYNIPPAITSIPQGQFPTGGFHLTQHEPIQVNNPPQSVEPLFKIDVANMTKLVKEVTGSAFGLELDDYNQALQDYLWVKIPLLGITDYIQGVAENGKLRFVNNTPSPPYYKLHPQQDFGNGIEIYVKTTGLISGKLAPKLVFKWEEATITTDEVNEGKFPLDNGDLAGFFGDSVKFKEVKGYIYVGGIGNSAKMSLKADNKNLVPDQSQLKERDHPSFSNRFNEEIPLHSLSLSLPQDPINMTETLNNSTSSKIDLEYKLNIDEIPIESKNVGSKKIFADLVILLPLEFTTSTPSSEPQYAGQYAKLDLKDFSLNTGDGDLFNRQGNDDDLFNSIKTVRFILSNIQNDILGGKVFFMIDTGYKTDLLDINKSRASVEFDISHIPHPFNPQLEILIEKDNSGSALFWLKRVNPGNDHAAFDFSLTVEVKTDIDQTITF